MVPHSGQRTVLSTLGEIGAEVEAAQVRPPAIVVVGEVVAVAHPDEYAQREPWPS